MKNKVIIFLYNRLFDPLIQSNFWLYILDYLDQEGDIDFILITYEDENYPLSDDQKHRVREWQSKGLEWKPLRWNSGIGFSAKFADIFQGFWALCRLRLSGQKHVVSLASVAGTYVYLYSRLLGLKYFLYQFEPHSEYARDNGMWPEGGWQFRISHYLEKKAALNARVISSGTNFMRERVENVWKVNARFFRIPTVANDAKFIHNEEDRVRVREELNLDHDTPLLFYPGKFGGLYYSGETAKMFAWLKKGIPGLKFLIVTPHEDEEVIGYFKAADVGVADYRIVHCSYDVIHRYYSSADLAVIAVPPGPSKQFISNIKVGEYLCAGLPFLITKGVSEDYVYADQKDVGIVVDDFDEESINSAIPKVQKYLDEPKDLLRQRCREFGLDYRGFQNLNQIFKKAISHLLNHG